MVGNILVSLVLSLGLTLLLELGGAALIGIRTRHDLLTVLAVNVLTNPPLVLFLNLITLYVAPPSLWLVLCLEAVIWGTEGFIYFKALSYRRVSPWLLSVLLNALSFAGGLLL